MIFKALHKNKIANSNFMEIMAISIEGKKYIEELESHLEEHEVTIEKMEAHERDYTQMRSCSYLKLLNMNKPPPNLLRRLLL